MTLFSSKIGQGWENPDSPTVFSSKIRQSWENPNSMKKFFQSRLFPRWRFCNDETRSLQITSKLKGQLKETIGDKYITDIWKLYKNWLDINILLTFENFLQSFCIQGILFNTIDSYNSVTKFLMSTCMYKIVNIEPKA